MLFRSVLDRQGKYDEAEKLHRHTLELSEKVLRKDHPQTITCMSSLAGVLSKQGKSDEAEKMHRQLVVSKEKMLGKEHPKTHGL